MDSGMIGKIDKAKRYAEERERISFNSFEVTFRGDNNTHTIQYQEGKWNCTCSFFQTRGVCGHTMAMEIILEGMLPSGEKPK
jgi:carotenoid cleavage dioxygenase-like enzyme